MTNKIFQLDILTYYCGIADRIGDIMTPSWSQECIPKTLCSSFLTSVYENPGGFSTTVQYTYLSI